MEKKYYIERIGAPLETKGTLYKKRNIAMDQKRVFSFFSPRCKSI